MATNYATVADIQSLKRSLTQEEQDRANALIPVISSLIRVEAKKIGKDFDQMIEENPDLSDVAKGVVCDVVMRELNTPGTQLPATSYSEAAGGVSQSYSLPNSSGSIKLWPSDLKTLGLKRQQISALSLMKERREWS
jgi:hypothetical protein